MKAVVNVDVCQGYGTCAEIMPDARRIADYYRERYGRDSEMIPYGAETGPVATAAELERLGLERRKYFLCHKRGAQPTGAARSEVLFLVRNWLIPERGLERAPDFFMR